jgi:hypothetical protein
MNRRKLLGIAIASAASALTVQTGPSVAETNDAYRDLMWSNLDKPVGIPFAAFRPDTRDLPYPSIALLTVVG